MLWLLRDNFPTRAFRLRQRLPFRETFFQSRQDNFRIKIVHGRQKLAVSREHIGSLTRRTFLALSVMTVVRHLLKEHAVSVVFSIQPPHFISGGHKLLRNLNNAGI